MATPTSTISGTVSAAAVHVGTSTMGNPTYCVQVDGVDYRTETNGQIGYAAGNFHPGTRVVVTLTPAGRVRGIVRDDDAEARGTN